MHAIQFQQNLSSDTRPVHYQNYLKMSYLSVQIAKIGASGGAPQAGEAKTRKKCYQLVAKFHQFTYEIGCWWEQNAICNFRQLFGDFGVNVTILKFMAWLHPYKTQTLTTDNPGCMDTAHARDACVVLLSHGVSRISHCKLKTLYKAPAPEQAPCTAVCRFQNSA